MKQEAVTCINRIGKIGQIIELICRIVMIIGLVAMIGLTVIVAVIPEGFLSIGVRGAMEIGVDLGALGVELSEEEQNEIADELDASKGELAMSFDGLKVEADSVETSVEDSKIQMTSTSETIQMMERFKLLATCIVAMLELMLALVTVIFAGRLCKAFRYCETPFGMDVIKKMTQLAYALIPWAVLHPTLKNAAGLMFSNEVQFTVDIGMIIVVLLVLALTYIFKYGAMLQQESDETL